jgi:hypothetical protein
MYMAIRRWIQGVGLATAMGLCLATPSAALKADEPLSDAELAKKIAAQKIEKDILDAREEAFETGKYDSAKGLEALKALLVKVDEASVLTKEKRDALKQSINRSIRHFEREVKIARIDTPAKQAKEIEKDKARRTDEEKRGTDSKGPFDVAKTRIEGTAAAIQENERLKKERAESYLRVMGKVEESMVLPKGDIQFPKDWVEKSKLRAKDLKLTDKEKAVLEALNKPIPAEFKGTPLSEVIDYLEKSTGATIIIDKQALDEAGVTYETTVTFRTSKATMRTVLRKVLGDLNLGYIVEDGIIRVMTLEQARNTLTTRVYYVGDLAGISGYGPFNPFGQAQAALAISQIVQLIVTNIEPQSWDFNGGPGSIRWDPTTMSLVIKQSAEVHYKMRGYAP